MAINGRSGCCLENRLLSFCYVSDLDFGCDEVKICGGCARTLFCSGYCLVGNDGFDVAIFISLVQTLNSLCARDCHLH